MSVHGAPIENTGRNYRFSPQMSPTVPNEDRNHVTSPCGSIAPKAVNDSSMTGWPVSLAADPRWAPWGGKRWLFEQTWPTGPVAVVAQEIIDQGSGIGLSLSVRK
jgi:hypothetical protein